MKKINTPLIRKAFFSCLFLVTAIAVKCQVPQSSWFRAQQLSQNIWRIDDHGADNMYLVIGNDSALLIDTGLGAANLRDYVKSFTTLPLIVVNTHGHPDHAGANYQFETVYAHPADFQLIAFFSKPDQRRNAGRLMMGGASVPDHEKFTDTLDMKPVILKPVQEGQVFDLGGCTLEVIGVPGHTQGSICLLDREDKVLFTGDNDNTLVWLHIQGCAPLETYLRSLEKLQSRVNEFTTLMPGHGLPIESSFISEQIDCVKSILDGSCEAKPYESFAGNGMTCTYKRATVAYNPNNLRK
jgi:glyoxylase-like metal-dependent hydrolase (beta-lactamase superfamily II)